MPWVPAVSFLLEIPSVIHDMGKRGVLEVIRRNKLTVQDDAIVITSSEKNCNAETLREYHNRWEEIKKFCYLIGDYESAVLLDRKNNKVVNPLPVKPKTLCMYMEWKTYDKKIDLTKYMSTELALDVKGNKIPCSNSWHCPGMI
jgi:hypothetical protein